MKGLLAHMSVFVCGIVLGLILTDNPYVNGNIMIHLVGYASIVMGIVCLWTKSFAMRICGGLLLGFAIGTITGSLIFPVAPIPFVAAKIDKAFFHHGSVSTPDSRLPRKHQGDPWVVDLGLS